MYISTGVIDLTYALFCYKYSTVFLKMLRECLVQLYTHSIGCLHYVMMMKYHIVNLLIVAALRYEDLCSPVQCPGGSQKVQWLINAGLHIYTKITESGLHIYKAVPTTTLTK